MFGGRKAIWDAQDCALIFIDYQPEMFRGMHSGNNELIEMNACMLARSATAFGIPVILSTVGVQMGVNQPTIDGLRRELPGIQEIDRSSMNAWEDEAFVSAVKATGKKKLIFCALWTEICLAFPVVEALADDFEVSFVVDAVGGESLIEHDMAVARLIQAGAVPNTTIATVAEWFRDWKSPLATKGRELLKAHWAAKAKAGPMISHKDWSERGAEDRPQH